MRIFAMFFVLVGFVYGGDVTISFNKMFETSIKPDTLNASLTFTSTKLAQDVTTDKLTDVSDYMSGIKNIKITGGNYSINPHYVYESKKRYQDGYDGYVSYSASSKSSDALNKFIREAQSFGEKNGLNVSVSSTSWGVSPEQNSDDLSDALRVDAISWAKKYANKLSNRLSSDCSVSKVEFLNDGYNQPIVMRAMAYEKSDRAPTPIQDNQKIQINSNITVICK